CWSIVWRRSGRIRYGTGCFDLHQCRDRPGLLRLHMAVAPEAGSGIHGVCLFWTGRRGRACRRESAMQYIACLREQAAYYHELAAVWLKANKFEEATEYEDLAETCEEVAAEIED